jgi:hypothetical protein
MSGTSKLIMRISAGVLVIISGILAYISRKEPEFPLSRVFIPNLQTRVTYIWQLLVAAGLLLVTAVILFLLSFRRSKA